MDIFCNFYLRNKVFDYLCNHLNDNETCYHCKSVNPTTLLWCKDCKYQTCFDCSSVSWEMECGCVCIKCVANSEDILCANCEKSINKELSSADYCIIFGSEDTLCDSCYNNESD